MSQRGRAGDGMNSDDLIIPGNLVRYLRRGAVREQVATLDALINSLSESLYGSPDGAIYHNALARFDEARAILDTLGIAERRDQPDVELDLDRWPRLVLRSLETEYGAELRRRDEEEAYGLHPPWGELEALGSLVADVRSRVDPRPKRIRFSLRLSRKRVGGAR